jgi:hypothetical protein
VILSTIRKIQAIANILNGRDIDVNPNDLGDPWQRYYKWIKAWIEEDPTDVDLTRLRYDFLQECGRNGKEDIDNYELIMVATRDPVGYVSVDGVLSNLPDLEWLWKEWIPRGMLSVLAATPGTGKSYFMLDVARRVINGSVFPDDTPVLAPGRVLYMDAENAPAIFKRRLEVWNDEELQNLFLMLPDPDRLVINLDDEIDRDRFLDMVCVIQPVLAIVDSYGSATLRGDRNKEDVQEMLAFLNKVAVDHRLAMFLAHHLRKRADGQMSFLPMTLDSIRGSSHIPAMARNVLGMQWIPTSEKPDENGPRKLWVMKSNIGRYPDALGVFFEPHPDNPDVALIRYGEAPEPFREPTKGDRCEAWLASLLQDAAEPMKPKEIYELGEEEGFNERMIRRVRKRLGEHIKDTAEDKHCNDNCWEWADQTSTQL